MRGVLSACVASLLAQATVALAQTPVPGGVDPGASCRHVAEQKAGAMLWPRPHIDEADGRVLARAHHEARYDEARGRCFLEVYQHYTQAGHTEVERRQLYNAMSDELLAMTEARSGKQSGMVFDRRHRMTTGSNLG